MLFSKLPTKTHFVIQDYLKNYLIYICKYLCLQVQWGTLLLVHFTIFHNYKCTIAIIPMRQIHQGPGDEDNKKIKFSEKTSTEFTDPKSKSGMVTRDSLHLEIGIFPGETAKMKISIQCVVPGNRYFPRGRKEDVLNITVAGNMHVSLTR